MSPDLEISSTHSSNNTSNNSLFNLFADSENVTPSPTTSPFKFGPLPPSPYCPHPPAMEIIMEVTETGTTSSENASSPRTEIQILDDDLKTNNEKQIGKKSDDELSEGEGERKQKHPIDICEKIQYVTDEEKKIKEYIIAIKQRKEDLKSFVDCHIDDNEVFRRYVEEGDTFRKYTVPK
jgi:hypothetical protein